MEDFLKQYVIDTSGEMHQCTMCEYNADDFADLNFHFRTSHVQDPSHCPICTKFCSSVQGVFKHFVAFHTLIRPYRCKLCNIYASVSRAEVVNHVVFGHRVDYPSGNNNWVKLWNLKHTIYNFDRSSFYNIRVWIPIAPKLFIVYTSFNDDA